MKTLALGQRVYDEACKEFGTVVMRVGVDGEPEILEGYEENAEILEWQFAVTESDERLILLDNSGAAVYTYLEDFEVTEVE